MRKSKHVHIQWAVLALLDDKLNWKLKIGCYCGGPTGYIKMAHGLQRMPNKEACDLLSAEGLTPDDLNVEANERVFSLVMGAEHGGRVRVAGFGVTPTKFFSESTKTQGQSSRSSDIGIIHKLQKEFKSFKDKSQLFQEKSDAFQEEMRAFMEEFRRTKSKERRSHQDDESD